MARTATLHDAVPGADWDITGWVLKNAQRKDLSGDSLTFDLKDETSGATLYTATSDDAITQDVSGNIAITVPRATTATLTAPQYAIELWLIDGASGKKTQLIDGTLYTTSTS